MLATPSLLWSEETRARGACLFLIGSFKGLCACLFVCFSDWLACLHSLLQGVGLGLVAACSLKLGVPTVDGPVLPKIY